MPKLYRRHGVWHYGFTVAGRRQRKSTGTADRRLAGEIAAEEESRQRRLARLGPQAVLTFGEAVALYLEAHKSPRFLLPLMDRLERVRVAEITGEFLKGIAAELYPQAGPATRNRQVLTPAQAVINHAAEYGLCQRIAVRRFKAATRERQAGDWEWIEAFASACQQEGKPQLSAMAVLMFTTGARIGQAIRLLWKDIDLSAATVIIPAAKRSAAREAHLVPECVAALAGLRPEPVEGAQNSPFEKVFGYTRFLAHKHWREIVRKYGLPPLTPHEAGRHGYGTQTVVRAGIDPATAARGGGWASPNVLLKTYAHARRDHAVVAKAFARKR